jgi:hypothetical protein
MPSTCYQIDANNNKFTVQFNQLTFTEFYQYRNLTLEDSAGDLDNLGGPVADRESYARTVSVVISVGDYTIEELMAEVKDKLNAACTTANTANREFRTFLRSAFSSPPSALWTEDTTDDGSGVVHTKDYVKVVPQFDWEFTKKLNKIRLYRTDKGGKMSLGQFTIQTSGQKLAMALGLSHNTAQEMKDAGVSKSQTTSVEASVHYRLHNSAGLTEHYNFPILTPAGGETKYGHSVMSRNCVNMFANDSVYVRCLNLPGNAYETLNGNQTNIMAVIPLYSASGADNFHSPEMPTSTVIGKMGISDIDVKLTDAMGAALDLNGVEWEFQLLMEVIREKESHPPLAHDMPGAHARESAPKPQWSNNHRPTFDPGVVRYPPASTPMNPDKRAERERFKSGSLALPPGPQREKYREDYMADYRQRQL